MTETARGTARLKKRWGAFIKGCEYIGVSSAGIIIVSGIFVGAVLGHQYYTSFRMFGAEAMVGGALGVTLFREMAPFMAAIMVTGRAGAAITAQLASMRISEQIDALEVMAVDPIELLIMPRVLAGIVMLPLLSVLFAGVASLAGSWVACDLLGLDNAVFWTRYARSVDAYEMVQLLVKAGVFGFALSTVACFFGYRARGGAEAVGLTTRTTVVVSMLSILFLDYITTALMPAQSVIFSVQ